MEKVKAAESVAPRAGRHAQGATELAAPAGEGPQAVAEATATRATGSTWSLVRPVVVLVAICVVAGALLGAVHHVTAPVIAAAEERRAEETYAALVPAAASFEEVPCEAEGCVAALHAVDEAGEQLGTVIVAEAKGYGGDVPLAVAFDLAGTVISVTVMPNDETPGLGSRAADESYVGQYVGLPAEPITDADVDLISGATISSRAVLSAFNRAVAAYEEVG